MGKKTLNTNLCKNTINRKSSPRAKRRYHSRTGADPRCRATWLPRRESARLRWSKNCSKDPHWTQSSLARHSQRRHRNNYNSNNWEYKWSRNYCQSNQKHHQTREIMVQLSWMMRNRLHHHLGGMLPRGNSSKIHPKTHQQPLPQSLGRENPTFYKQSYRQGKP